MWGALGGCYEKMRKHRDAAKCLEKSEKLKDSEQIALFKLGKLYVSMKENERAANCFEEHIKKKDEDKLDDFEFVECHTFLAQYYSQVNREKSKFYLKKLIEFGGNEGEKAK